MKINKKAMDILLAENCLSIKELAKKIGITPGNLTRIRQGQKNTRPKTIGLIAKALKVDINELLEDDN